MDDPIDICTSIESLLRLKITLVNFWFGLPFGSPNPTTNLVTDDDKPKCAEMCQNLLKLCWNDFTLTELFINSSPTPTFDFVTDDYDDNKIKLCWNVLQFADAELYCSTATALLQHLCCIMTAHVLYACSTFTALLQHMCCSIICIVTALLQHIWCNHKAYVLQFFWGKASQVEVYTYNNILFLECKLQLTSTEHFCL